MALDGGFRVAAGVLATAVPWVPVPAAGVDQRAAGAVHPAATVVGAVPAQRVGVGAVRAGHAQSGSGCSTPGSLDGNRRRECEPEPRDPGWSVPHAVAAWSSVGRPSTVSGSSVESRRRTAKEAGARTGSSTGGTFKSSSGTGEDIASSPRPQSAVPTRLRLTLVSRTLPPGMNAARSARPCTGPGADQV